LRLAYNSTEPNMTDSIDKKTKEKPNLEVDLDAMLDDAESSLAPINELQDDEDAIDRLLMDAGFGLDDELTQPEASDANAVNDIDLHDELDDFLGFDDFVGDFDKPEQTQTVVEPEQGVGNISLALSDEHQDDEDAIDRLLMNAGIDADNVPMPVIDDLNPLEELDEFSDFSDFNEPEIDQVPELMSLNWPWRKLKNQVWRMWLLISMKSWMIFRTLVISMNRT